jgi:sec-independent protein translocase protein TatB
MTSLQKDVGDALQIDDIDKPPSPGRAGTPGGGRNDRRRRRRPAAPTPETFVEAEAHAAASRAAGDHARSQAAPQDIRAAGA